jgi:type I restriction enzyme S subunit
MSFEVSTSLKSLALGDICSPKQHPTISGTQLTESGYPVYGANGQIGFYSSYTHAKPTIAVTCRGATCGTIHIVPAFSYITGNAMALDSLDETKADLSYLAWCLRARGFQDVISGSAQPQITGQPLRRIKLALPSLDAQRRIAAILDQADELRRKQQASLKKIDTLIASLQHQAFAGTLAPSGAGPTLASLQRINPASPPAS